MLGISSHLRSVHDVLSLLFRHRLLIWVMARKEVLDRHAGQSLGGLWVICHPLLMMGVYVLVFSYILRVRVPGDAPLDYTVYLLSGLIPWTAVADIMNRSTQAIMSNASVVKQMVFPVEVLPVKVVFASLVTQTIASAMLLLYAMVTGGGLPWTVALLPLLWFIQVVGVIGVGFFLSSLTPFLRDTKELIQVACVVGLYAMPVSYLPEWVPAPLQPLMYLNPFSYMVWCFQDVCYFGYFAHPWAWVVFPLESAVAFVLGYRVFRSIKPQFGYVL